MSINAKGEVIFSDNVKICESLEKRDGELSVVLFPSNPEPADKADLICSRGLPAFPVNCADGS
jgi:hypothetical protein